MILTPDNKLKKLIVIGDRILIKPLQPDQRTASGLYLPPGVQEKKKFSRDMLSKLARLCNSFAYGKRAMEKRRGANKIYSIAGKGR